MKATKPTTTHEGNIVVVINRSELGSKLQHKRMTLSFAFAGSIVLKKLHKSGTSIEKLIWLTVSPKA